MNIQDSSKLVELTRLFRLGLAVFDPVHIRCDIYTLRGLHAAGVQLIVLYGLLEIDEA